jgi:hypothetical protein
MDPKTTPSDDKQPRDTAYWSQTSTLKVGKVPTGALNLNVEGRQLLGPLQGFGQLWQKTFRIRLNGVTVKPTEVIHMWKENFPKFWPKWNHFYKSLGGIAPGEVALINMLIPGDIPHGLPLSTGILVLYADEESFTFMSPQGLMFAGWITFSAYEEDDGCTIAQIRLQVRANDPAYEIGFRLGASRSENRLWQHALTEMAAYYGVTEPVQTEFVCIDPRVQWSQFWNIWQNAAIRTFLYKMLTPVRWTIKRVWH